MQKRTTQNVGKNAVKTIGLPEACARYGLGKNTMRKVAEDAGQLYGSERGICSMSSGSTCTWTAFLRASKRREERTQ